MKCVGLALVLSLVAGVAQAQNTIPQQPAAVNILSSDLALIWQNSQDPHTRQSPLTNLFQAITGQVGFDNTVNMAGNNGGNGSPAVVSSISSVNTNPDIAVRAQGTGSVRLGTKTDGDAVIIVDNGTVTNTFQLKAGTASTANYMFATGGNIGLTNNNALATNATTGFMGIPTCNGTPAGVPANADGGVGFLCYNYVSHTLNIYDQPAASWYHIALSAGAG